MEYTHISEICLKESHTRNYQQFMRGALYLYGVFRAQAEWTLTHTSPKDTEQRTIEASTTLDGVTLTD
jgi:hypothetical protein